MKLELRITTTPFDMTLAAIGMQVGSGTILNRYFFITIIRQLGKLCCLAWQLVGEHADMLKRGDRDAAARKNLEPAVAIEAMRLLGKWTLLAQQYVSSAGGCSCCAGFGGMPVQGFEQDILEFLHGRHAAAAGISDLMTTRGGYKPNESGSIAEVLRAMATQADASIRAEDQLALLADLERSIDSLEEMQWR